MAKGYYHLEEGEWHEPVHRGFHLQCCDCGLVHVFDFKVVEGKKITFRTRRNERATAAVRRQFKFDKRDRDT